MKPRIAFDAKRYFYNKSGLGRHNRTLINTALEINQVISWIPVVANSKKSKLAVQSYPFLEQISNNTILPNTLWRQFYTHVECQKEKCDLYIGLSAELPYHIHQIKSKSVLFVHDLLFIDRPLDYKYIDRQIYRWKLKNAVKSADLILTVSKYTSQRLSHFFPDDSEKIQCLYPPVDLTFWSRREPSSHLLSSPIRNLPEEFILYVGTWGIRKNLKSLLEAMSNIGWPVPVVVCGTDHHFRFNHPNHKVLFLPYLTDEELRYLYQKATLFIQPSLAEGFGLPIVEGLAAGAKILCSDIPPFREAGGSLVHYFSPHDLNALSESILNLIEHRDRGDHGLSQHLSQFDRYSIAQNFINSILQLL